MIFDTHAHYYDSRFDDDRDNLLLHKLPDAGVEYVVNVSADMDSCKKTLALAHKYPYIYAAVGVHPHDASHMTDADLYELANMTKQPKVVAIGEIGLDYHYDYSPRDVQCQRFRQQLDLAVNLELPVIIHDREAHSDCLSIIDEFPNIKAGVFHCYSGSLEMAKLLVKKGWFISFTGNVTFTNAKKLWEVAAWVPDDRLMIETDCPYMAPVPHRGQRNDSSLLVHLSQKLAELRGSTAPEIERLTFENAVRFFRINGIKGV